MTNLSACRAVQRKMLGDPDARHVGRDRFEQAPIPGIGIRLGIERIELAHAAGKPEVDHGDVALGPGAGDCARRRRTSPQAQNPNTCSEPTFRNDAPVEIRLPQVDSMVIQKLLRVEDRPQNILECLPARPGSLARMGSRARASSR